MATDRRGHRHRGVWHCVFATEHGAAADCVRCADHVVEQRDVVLVSRLSERAVHDPRACPRHWLYLFIQPHQHCVRQLHHRLFPATGRRDRGVRIDRFRDADGGPVDRLFGTPPPRSATGADFALNKSRGAMLIPAGVNIDPGPTPTSPVLSAPRGGEGRYGGATNLLSAPGTERPGGGTE